MNSDYVLYRRKGQRIWYFYWYEESGKRVFKTTGKTKKYLAKEYAESYVEKLSTPDVKLEEYAKNFFVWGECSWIKRQHAKGRPFSESTAKHRRGNVKKYILPRFGGTNLAQLNRVEIENWLIGLNLSNQTKNHILYSFRIILREAEAEKKISDNPLEKVEPMAAVHKKRDVLTFSELKLLFPQDEIELMRIWKTQEKAVAFLLLATSGMRTGELRALTWNDILWQGGIIVNKSVKLGRTIGNTKTNDIRVVLLPNRTMKALEDWKQKTPFPEEDDLVVYGQGPKYPVSREYFCYFFPRALKRAGIETNGRNLVPHSFRHTFNTLLRPIVPEPVLRKLTGHKSKSMTDLYDHPTIESMFSGLSASKNLIESAFTF